MTYEKFLAESKRRQLAYIRKERKRMDKAWKAWNAFRDRLADLGLHPLNEREIIDRVYELKGMAANVDETHGDTPAMRSLWEARFQDAA